MLPNTWLTEASVVSLHVTLSCSLDVIWRQTESGHESPGDPKSVFPTKSYLCDSLSCQISTLRLLFETSMQYTSSGQNCIFGCVFFVSMKPYVLCTKHTVNHTLSNELLLLTHIVKWKCLSTACQTWVFLVLVTSQGRSDISSHEKHQTFWPQPVFCTLQDTL